MEYTLKIIALIGFLAFVCGDNKLLVTSLDRDTLSAYKGQMKNDWRMNALYANLMESSYMPSARQDRRMYKASDNYLQIPEIIDPFRDVFRRRQ